MSYTQELVESFAQRLKTNGGTERYIKYLMQQGQQKVHTPFDLCREMLSKLKHYGGFFENKEIAVLFNLEFVHILITEYSVPQENITFFAEDERKEVFAIIKYGMKNVFRLDMKKTIEEENGFYIVGGEKVMKKFQVIVGNPPYQSDKKNKPLWQCFVEKIFELSKDGGEICLVHPSSWRKPNHSLLKKFQSKQLNYLEIHNQVDGLKVFGCGTRYDWYVLTNKDKTSTVEIVDENGKSEEVDIAKFAFIPNQHSAMLKNCISQNEPKLNIIHSRTMYGNDKPWMSKTKDENHSYPCIYSTPCNKPPSLLFSSKKDGHFGVKKVIIGKASPENCFYDGTGEFGVTNNCIAIIVDDEIEAQNIIKAIRSEKFKEIMSICKWAGFSIEPEVFESFKKDFWKEFI